MRLLTCERFEYLECRLRPTGESLRRSENEACIRMARDRLQDFVGLLGGECRILLEKPRCVRDSDIERPNGLRSAVQWNISRIPTVYIRV